MTLCLHGAKLKYLLQEREVKATEEQIVSKVRCPVLMLRVSSTTLKRI